jgi:hypothetical protein
MVVESEVPELSVPAVFNKVSLQFSKYVKRTFSPPFYEILCGENGEKKTRANCLVPVWVQAHVFPAKLVSTQVAQPYVITGSVKK